MSETLTKPPSPPTPSVQPRNGEKTRLRFDEDAAERVKAFLAGLLLQFPEVRSLSAVIDYSGDMNDTSLATGVWISEKEKSPAAIIGTINQHLKFVQTLLLRLDGMTVTVREELKILLEEKVKVLRAREQ